MLLGAMFERVLCASRSSKIARMVSLITIAHVAAVRRSTACVWKPEFSPQVMLHDLRSDLLTQGSASQNYFDPYSTLTYISRRVTCVISR